MNSFERFGIDHLSASSLNLWRTAPGIFALRYIAGIKDGGGPAMWRGTAVENGLAVLLHGQSLALAIASAWQSYDLNSKDYPDDVTEERDLVAPMVEQCAQWKAPSALAATQVRIEYWFDPIPVPVIGWLDFSFDEVDVDCKSTKALPSTPRPDHVRQVSIYRAARNKPGGLLYVTAKRHAYYNVTDEMMDGALSDMLSTALSLNNFLARMESKGDALRSLPVDYEHYQAPKLKIQLEELLLAQG